MKHKNVDPYLSDRLHDFIYTYLDADADFEGVAERLHDGGPKPFYAAWLEQDMRTAIEHHSLTSDLLETLTGLAIPDEAAADEWLRELWAGWFPGKDYPKAKAKNEP